MSEREPEVITLFGTDYWMVPKPTGPGFVTVPRPPDWNKVQAPQWQDALMVRALTSARLQTMRAVDQILEPSAEVPAPYGLF